MIFNLFKKYFKLIYQKFFIKIRVKTFKISKQVESFSILSSIALVILLGGVLLGTNKNIGANSYDKVMVDVSSKQESEVSSRTEITIEDVVKTSRAAPKFYDDEPRPLKPDMVIFTKNLSKLPNDIIQSTFLKKVFTKKQMSYYEDSPFYQGAIGFIRRISFEHNVGLKDNIVKYILSMPGELALWKSYDGKLKKFLFIADKDSIKQNIINAYLTIKNLSGDNNVVPFYVMGEEGFSIRILDESFRVLSKEGQFYITNLNNKYFPFFHEKALSKKIEKKFEKKISDGFYKKLYNINKYGEHSVLINMDYISGGYSYFIPTIEMLRVDFSAKKSSVYMLSNGGSKKTVKTSNLWKAIPNDPALCTSIPVDQGKVFNVIQKYNKYIEEKKEIAVEKKEKQKDESKELEMLFSREEVVESLEPVAGVCWFKESELYTPVFITKLKKANEKKLKIKFYFKKLIGALENNDKESPFSANEEENVLTLSRKISSRYGINYDADKNLKYSMYFKTKLSVFKDYLIFSPDSRLVDLVLSTLKAKSPSLVDKYKVKDKNLAMFIDPKGISKLTTGYISDALMGGKEEILLNAVNKHLSKILNRFATIKPMALMYPDQKDSDFHKWNLVSIENYE